MGLRSVAAIVAALAVLGRGVGYAAPRIVNGTLTGQFPSVGALLAGSDPDSAEVICSGTLIGCQTFLTAGHCVCETFGGACQPGGPNAPDPTGLFVFLQHGGIFAVSSIDVRSDFLFPVGDVAVVHLASPVTGVRPTRINATAAPRPGTPGQIVGFGDSGTALDYGLKRTGGVTTAQCTPDVSPVTSVCFDFAEPVGPPGTNSNTCNGDSGGPLFVDFGCGPTVAGVTSGGSSATCSPLDHAYDANVFTYAADLAAAAGSDLDAPACGSMPQAGEAGTTIFEFTGRLDPLTPQATQQFTVSPGTTRLRVALNAIDDGASDFDLDVWAGSSPLPLAFDCSRDGPGQFAVCDLAAPAPGTWSLRVSRFRGAGDYQATVTTFAAGLPGPGADGLPCNDENPCTGPGVCSAGHCTDLPLLTGTPCDDGTGCTTGDVCVAGVCAGTPAPATGCRRSVVAGKGLLQLKATPLGARDQLGWKWNRGEASSATDFGNPVTTTAYELCVFALTSGPPALLVSARVPPGPAWSALPRGFKYRDHHLAFGDLSAIDLRAGGDGAAAVAVKAKGGSFRSPPLPIATPAQVVVQLDNGGACWQGTFSTPQVNLSTQFKAKSD